MTWNHVPVTGLRIARVVALAMIALGLVLPVAAFLLTAATYLPYQDPPPEIAQRYAEETARSDRLNHAALTAGAMLAGAGAALLIYLAVRRHRSVRRAQEDEFRPD
jgi:hypothetical protein